MLRLLILLLCGCGRETSIVPDPVGRHADATTTTTATTSAPSVVPSVGLSPDWCRDGAGRANDTIAAHVTLSARSAVRAALRSSVGRELADGGAVDLRVRCPMPAECDSDEYPSCQYVMRFSGPDSEGILRTKDSVYVSARTGKVIAGGSLLHVPMPAP